MLLVAQSGQAAVFEISEGGAVSVRAGMAEVAEPNVPTATFDPGQEADVAAPAAYAADVARIAAANDLSPALLEALVWQESRWNAQAISPAGAIGLAQLMPATARSLGVNPYDPRSNLAGGARYLRQQLDLFDGDIEKALAAYNAGPVRVLKANAVPAIAETRAYVTAIVRRLSANSPKQPSE